MKPVIHCKVTRPGIHSFYMISDGHSYYMFSQDYQKSVHEYFSKGVSLDKAIDFSKSHKDSDVMRTMSKIPMYIKYIECEYEIKVLERSKKKSRRTKTAMKKCA